jgi:hypothetical protein
VVDQRKGIPKRRSNQRRAGAEDRGHQASVGRAATGTRSQVADVRTRLGRASDGTAPAVHGRGRNTGAREGRCQTPFHGSAGDVHPAENGLQHGHGSRLAQQVRFNKTWKTAYWHGRTLHRWQGSDANFYDVETREEFWVSGPHRDRRDVRYSGVQPTVDDDIRDVYAAFLDGAPLPGREHG